MLYDYMNSIQQLLTTRDKIKEKIAKLKSKQGVKARVFDDIQVNKTRVGNSNQDLSLAICQLEMDLEEIERNIKLELKIYKNSLGPLQYNIMICKLNGLTNRDTAAKLGMSEATYYRALKKECI